MKKRETLIVNQIKSESFPASHLIAAMAEHACELIEPFPFASLPLLLTKIVPDMAGK